MSEYIKNNFSVQINDYIPVHLRYEIVVRDEINLFVHSSILDR